VRADSSHSVESSLHWFVAVIQSTRSCQTTLVLDAAARMGRALRLAAWVRPSGIPLFRRIYMQSRVILSEGWY
jgi:hypothetical protein